MDILSWVAQEKESRKREAKKKDSAEKACIKEHVFFAALQHVNRLYASTPYPWDKNQCDFRLTLYSEQDYFRRVLNIVLEHFQNPKGIWAKFNEDCGSMDFSGVLISKATGKRWHISITGEPDTTCKVTKEETVREITEYKYKLDKMADCL